MLRHVAMTAEDTFDYKQLNEAILAKYELNEEVYQQQFREADFRLNENPREFYNTLKDNKWIQPEKRTKDQVGDILILEQFYYSLSLELRVWVKESDPKLAQGAAQWWIPSWHPSKGQ